MNTMSFEHKCRRCGAVDHGPTALDRVVFADLLKIAVTGKEPPAHGCPIMLTTVHQCEDGGYGLSDLIGARKDT